jgi:hypothetical protein
LKQQKQKQKRALEECNKILQMLWNKESSALSKREEKLDMHTNTTPPTTTPLTSITGKRFFF